jgi:hypothetical protein
MKEELSFSLSRIKDFCCLTFNLYPDSSVHILTSTGNLLSALPQHTHLCLGSSRDSFLGSNYDDDHSLLCGAKVMILQCYTSTPHIFVARCLSKHSKNYFPHNSPVPHHLQLKFSVSLACKSPK